MLRLLELLKASTMKHVYRYLIKRHGQNEKKLSIFYLAAELKHEKMFVQRRPVKETARRAGWQDYLLNGDEISSKVVRLK